MIFKLQQDVLKFNDTWSSPKTDPLWTFLLNFKIKRLNKQNKPRTQDLETQDQRLRTPKSGTPALRTFLLSFKIKRWKVRIHLKVNVITQGILLHIFPSKDYWIFFSWVKVCFLKNIKTDSIRVLPTSCFLLYLKQLEKEIGEDTFSLTLSN